MEKLKQNDILSEWSIFTKKYDEVSYLDVIDQFRKMTIQLKKAINKTVSCKSIKVYEADEKKNLYPKMFVLSKTDYRVTVQQYLTEPFSIFELERDSGLTENIVIKELNNIFNELNYTYKDIGVTFISPSEGVYRFYAYLDFKKCLKNIIDDINPRIEKHAREITKELREKKEAVITKIKNNKKLGKSLKFNRSYKPEFFKCAAASGSGICCCLQEQADGFIESDLDYLKPELNPWSLAMNLAYELEETILKDSNISLYGLPNKNGSYSLWLMSKPNIKVIY